MRLPCRTTTDDRYFGDEWQALPRRGYTRIFENMLLGDPNVTIRVNADYFDYKARGVLPEHSLLVYTGPIDSYFAQQGMPRLEYRSIVFEEEWVPNPPDGFFQEAMVVNYPGKNYPFTRIVEYKHVPNQPQAVLDGQDSVRVLDVPLWIAVNIEGLHMINGNSNSICNAPCLNLDVGHDLNPISSKPQRISWQISSDSIEVNRFTT